MRWWWIGFLLLLCLVNLDVWRSAQGLPDRVVTKFDVSGGPLAFMSRETYAITMLITINFVSAISAGAFAVIRKLPPELVNLPHKEIWLSDIHRDATYLYLGRIGVLLSTVTLIFFAWLNRAVIVAHQFHPPQLSNPWVGAGVLIGAVLLLVVVLLRHFSQPPNKN